MSFEDSALVINGTRTAATVEATALHPRAPASARTTPSHRRADSDSISPPRTLGAGTSRLSPHPRPSGSPLEPGMKAFIVDVLAPKFTPTLIAGFACSISLGGLKALQLTSDDAQYSEGVQYSEEDD